jgi:hypothetical protein
MKAEIAEQEVAIAGQWHGKYNSTSTNQHATTEEPLETVFSVWSTLRLYSEDQQEKLAS